MPASAATLTQGTKEYLVVDVFDTTGLLTSMSMVSGLTFDVFDPAEASKYSAQPAAFNTMKVLCLIDTAHGGAWTTYNSGDPVLGAKQFRLYINWIFGGEAPRIGPFFFTVDPS